MGERSNLNGWYARLSVNVAKRLEIFADFTNYYGANKKGSINSHGYTGGLSHTFFPLAAVRPSAFVEAGDIRTSNVMQITNVPAFLAGFSLTLPLNKHLNLTVTPAEYVLLFNTSTGNRNNSMPRLASPYHSGTGEPCLPY